MDQKATQLEGVLLAIETLERDADSHRGSLDVLHGLARELQSLPPPAPDHWEVGFQEERAPGVWEDVLMVVSEEPTGEYIGCATPLFKGASMYEIDMACTNAHYLFLSMLGILRKHGIQEVEQLVRQYEDWRRLPSLELLRKMDSSTLVAAEFG
ncbi:hypothetical protein ACYPKM_01385 [Pseudomonas aeruginosa]